MSYLLLNKMSLPKLSGYHLTMSVESEFGNWLYGWFGLRVSPEVADKTLAEATVI